MAYEKQNFISGYILHADELNAMDDQIAANETAIEDLHKGQTVTQVLTEGTEIAKIGDTSLFAPEGGAGGITSAMVSITYAELKALRDSSSLVPGMQYRITDYKCGTIQEDTQAVNHPYDIIVTADDEKTLNHKARAIQHEGDTYFANCQLEKWQVWYDLDLSEKYPWIYKVGCYIDSDGYKYYLTGNTEVGTDGRIYEESDSDGTYYIVSEGGTYTACRAVDGFDSGWEVTHQEEQTADANGVVYRLIDDLGNDVPYDFKNIQFKRYKVNSTGSSLSFYEGYNGADTNRAYPNGVTLDTEDFKWCYTFDDENGNDTSLNASNNVNNNVFAQDDTFFRGLLNDVLFGDSCYSNTFGDGCYDNTFGESCYSNTFGDGCHNNIFGESCYSNTFGDKCYNNTFGKSCYRNTFGKICYGNAFDVSCYYNTFGHDCNNNTFGQACNGNTFAGNCYTNVFGNECYNNTFGQRCYKNTFGTECYSNVFETSCYSNTFEQGCRNNTFGQYCYSNTFGKNCFDNAFGHQCYENTFGQVCRYNTFGQYCWGNIFGQYCDSNTFENSNIFIKFDGSSAACNGRFIKVLAGICGKTSANPLVIYNSSDTYHFNENSSSAPEAIVEANPTEYANVRYRYVSGISGGNATYQIYYKSTLDGTTWSSATATL